MTARFTLIIQVLLLAFLEATVVPTLLVLGSHHRLRVRLKEHCSKLDIHSWFETSVEKIALAFNKTHQPEYIIIECDTHNTMDHFLCQRLKEDNPETRIILAHAAWMPAKESTLLPEHVDVLTTVQHSAKRLARHMQELH